MAGLRVKSTLAEQLAELENPAPVDIDPENAEHYAPSESDAESEDEEDIDDGRSHYVAVGKSRLRDSAAEQPLKAAYKGQKSNRQDIFGDEFTNDDEGDPIDSSDADAEDDDESLIDEDEDEDAQDADSASDSNSDQSEISGSEESEEEEPDSEDERQAADLKALLAEDQKTMVQEVVKTATAEAEKGRAVKKQLGIYDSLLDSRIKLQKGLQATNLLADAGTAFSETLATEQAALDLIESIFSLRDILQKQDTPETAVSRKRRYAEVEAVSSESIWEDIQASDRAMAAWRDKTLTKWSQKTQAVSAIDKSKKFKALNQGILAQIEESKSDRTKLLKRTQIKRFKASAKAAISAEDVSAEIYDDGDFYSEMLKDLIDSRMLDSANSSQMKWVATKQPKQKKANVDTRASKGRKLRFHVHEKIQNFMPPIPTGTWHEEQIDELFGSLFGQSMKVDAEDEDDQDQQAHENGDEHDVAPDDDFRIFG